MNSEGLLRAALALVVALPLIGGVARADEEAVVVEVQAGSFRRAETPVVFELPASLSASKAFRLTEEQSGRDVPVQLESGDKPRLVWMLKEPLAAQAARRYRLRAVGQPDQSPAAVIVRRTARAIEVEVDGKPVLHYNHAVVPSDDPEKPFFHRSGFIHPVFDPRGNVLTDGMPAGSHMHQHGIMFAWVDTTFEGRQIDFWNSAKQQGEVRHQEVLGCEDGPVFGSFAARLEHVDLTAPDGPKVALGEIWRVRVYDRSDGFLFDIHSTQNCASESPLTINKYRYGGMAFRGARGWLGAEGCEFLTNDGNDRISGNASRARWCDISGSVGDDFGGATVFCDPRNFRAPQPLRLHGAMPYFCWAPMIVDAFSIEPGKPYETRFRYFVHTGPPDARLADAIADDLAEPCRVEIVGGR